MRAERILPLFVLTLAAASGATATVAQADLAEAARTTLAPAQARRLEQVAGGAGEVQAAEAYFGSRGAIGAALDPQTRAGLADAAPAATTAQLVVMRGRFADTTAKVPPGTPPPTGTVMAFTIDPESGAILETYVGSRAPATQPLGAGESLAVPASTAPARTATLRRVAPSPRRRARAHAAVWGANCRVANEHHCYAVASWAMQGSEQVEGTETEQYTTNMNVPGWASGEFVDNEEWAVFPSAGYHLEIGQEAGSYMNCCTLYWFYAYTNASGYHAAEHIWAVAPNSWNAYFMRSIGNGVWCFDVGPNGEERYACYGGFPTYNKLLEDGAEVAAETEPANAGSVVANATWLNGSVHTWNFASEAHNGGMCVSPFAPVRFPGNINYGTC